MEAMASAFTIWAQDLGPPDATAAAAAEVVLPEDEVDALPSEDVDPATFLALEGALVLVMALLLADSEITRRRCFYRL